MQQTKVGRTGLSWCAVACLVALAGACKTNEPSRDTANPTESVTLPATPAAAPKPPAVERSAAPSVAEAQATVVQEPYGKLNGQAVDRYTLRNGNGLMLRVITYGAIITELAVPDRDGKLADVVLGFDELDDYAKGNPYFGAVVGRVANRIAGATFELEGKKYTLAANDKPHHLHGGIKGWDKVVWKGQALETTNGAALKLTHVSPDGDEGYPGTVTATTVYTLTADNALRVEMSATTDATTIVNMVQHTYWNLGGHGSGSIERHELQLLAAQYTPGEGLVPDGRIARVAGTPFDFTQPKPIGKDWLAVGGKPHGYDQNWVVDGEPHELRPVARLSDPASGRTMTLESDQPGVQFYSGNFLSGKPGKGGAAYTPHSGLCLETQRFPNSINVREWRDEVILSPGQTYRHTMVHRFRAE